MARSLFSPSWYRVAALRPRLRSHAEIHRQRFRGDLWYVVQDHQSGRFHRVSPAGYLVASLLDGRRTVADIWDIACARHEENPPTQDEVIQLLAQLHAADLLQGDAPPDLDELAERSQTRARREFFGKLKNPMALRFPLFDPNGILDAMAPVARPVFGVFGFLVWLGFVAAAIVVAALNWPELTNDVFDKVLTAQNVALLVCIYPIVKALHELGHGLATKVWGGEVHEFGVILLLMMPMPYVDASAAAAFRSKIQRVVVGGAGIMVELLLAAIAMIVWANTEPGLIRAAAFNVMLIGGVSTLLFNGNPLIRFDGYYILADIIEIPNLATRANRYFFYVVQKYLFGVATVESPVTARGERGWLFGYSVASFLYRMVIIFGIVMFVTSRFFFIGVLIALWALFGTFVTPLWKGATFLLSNPRLNGIRSRALAVSGAVALGVSIVLFAVPVPYATVVEGIVGLPDSATIRAGTEGVVASVLAASEDEVEAGQPLVQLEDPVLASRVEVAEAQLAELKFRHAAALVIDRVQANVLQEQIRHLEAALYRAEQRRTDLTLRAPVAGLAVIPAAIDLPGSFVKQGDALGFVAAPGASIIRVIVRQDDIDLVRNETRGIAVRFVDEFDETYEARILREVPAAASDVPSRALTTEGGGRIALDPNDPARTLQRLFLFDLVLTADRQPRTFGSRAYVRIDHGTEPIAWRLLRGARQLFLSHFDV